MHTAHLEWVEWIINIRHCTNTEPHYDFIMRFFYTFARYDTRSVKEYEGPCCCPEEVSLTSITDRIR